MNIGLDPRKMKLQLAQIMLKGLVTGKQKKDEIKAT
jgi:hypothetical protein